MVSVLSKIPASHSGQKLADLAEELTCKTIDQDMTVVLPALTHDRNNRRLDQSDDHVMYRTGSNSWFGKLFLSSRTCWWTRATSGVMWHYRFFPGMLGPFDATEPVISWCYLGSDPM
ncbi:hypothetical protein PoB_006830900 [Plakobranchus ocellatus]|uniref:Uncharacterized protein n=1 Tax=Plakobranchus ocellatus TaxID=259542 RepID=A0AAV4DCB3_9GAST|nr:hypothetical protein PoB_006830900 [Plakobranchus ocellatus]